MSQVSWACLIAVFYLPISGEAEELCPPYDAIDFGDHFYVVNDNYMSKIAATTACEELGKETWE